MTIYYSPEDYGLRQIGEVEWGDGYYSFDLTVLWQDIEEPSKFYVGDDSGCSCPSPFDSMSRSDLQPINNLAGLLGHLSRVAEGRTFYSWDEATGEDYRKAERIALVQKYQMARFAR